MRLDLIDVVSPEVYVSGVPHDQFAFLRRHAPVFRQTIPDPALVDEVWVVTRPAQIQQVSEDAATYSSAQGVNLRALMSEEFSELRKGNFIELDDPDHRRLRLMVAAAFTPRVVKTFTNHYQALTARVIGDAVATGSFDFVTDVAAQLPLLAICELLGAPESDRMQIFRWSNAALGATDPEYGGTEQDSVSAAVSLGEYAISLAQAKRHDPADDILSALATAADDERLTEAELGGFVFLLLVAGNETTRNNISHGLVALMENPDQFDLLRTNPADFLDRAVEEITRWASPVNYMARTATQDTSLHGQKIRAGDRVAMFYGSANRDEDEFPDGHRFDITHDYRRHYAFGIGRHFCLGAHLARIETRAVLTELLAATEDIRLGGPPTRQRTSFLNALKHLPVTVTAAS